MNAKQRKADQKRNYENIKDIKKRLADPNGEHTFQERQLVLIYDKRIAQKQNKIITTETQRKNK